MSQSATPAIVPSQTILASSQIDPPPKPAGGQTFDKVLSAINPIQQIPGAAQAYQAVTHDKGSVWAQFAGHVGIGAAIAGPIGAAAGAGVFALEHLVPGVFRTLGHLFSTGHSAREASPAPAIKLGANSVSPHIAPTASVTNDSEISPVAVQPFKALQGKNGTALPQLTTAQFAALFNHFGAEPATSSFPPVDSNNPQRGQNDGSRRPPLPTDLAATITANLEKYRRQKELAGGN